MKGLADEWSEIALLARTHGQPASPTRLGKEIEVFITRLEAQFKSINSIPNAAKFGGATGNFNAHKVAYPKINWQSFASKFLKDKLDLDHSFPTTQIEHYDHMAGLFDTLKRINTIIIDLDKGEIVDISPDSYELAKELREDGKYKFLSAEEDIASIKKREK